TCGNLDPCARQSIFQFREARRVGHYRKAWPVLPRLLDQRCNIAMRRQRHKVEAQAIAPDQIERRAADRTCRPQDGDAFHLAGIRVGKTAVYCLGGQGQIKTPAPGWAALCSSARSAAPAATATSPSTRSRIPP